MPYAAQFRTCNQRLSQRRTFLPDRETKIKPADEITQEIEAQPDNWPVRADLAELTGWVVQTRYPGERQEPAAGDAVRAE